MLLVMGNDGHTSLTTRDANHQVEVLDYLADALQAELLATEGFWNLIDAYNGIVVYQHLGLGYLQNISLTAKEMPEKVSRTAPEPCKKNAEERRIPQSDNCGIPPYYI
jgi:hypothetical protein